MEQHNNIDRIAWVDTAKAFGLYLMILGHGLVSENTQQYIYAFHMPLFFILSGLFYKSRSLTETLRKDWIRLIIPFIIIKTVVLFYDLLCKIVGHQPVALIAYLKKIVASYAGLGYNVGEWESVATPLWFLVALFLIHVILSSFQIATHKGFVGISLLSISIFISLKHFGIDTYVPLDSALMSIPFFCGGAIFRDFILAKCSIAKNLVVITICAIVFFTLSPLNGRISLNTCRVGHSMMLLYICAVTGSLMLMCICKILNIRLLTGGADCLLRAPF